MTGVRLVGERVTDDTLAKLSGLANLRRLSLGKTRITDRGLVRCHYSILGLAVWALAPVLPRKPRLAPIG